MVAIDELRIIKGGKVMEKGFIALYKGTNVYLIEESEYETHLKNPAIIYMVYREGSLLSLLIQADQIIGYSDQYHNLYFTEKGEVPNFELAGAYNDLQAREAAFLFLDELEKEVE